jgi:polar amino acid transport system substrate-binding protein
MKKIALATALSVSFASVVMAEQVKIGIAAEPYPPFATPDASGTFTGWEIDIINATCKAAAMDCVITPVAWDGIIPALTSGQIDAIMASMSITDERLKTIDFSDKYYNTPTVVIASRLSELAATPEGIAGKIIGVQVSTIHEAYVQKYFAATAAEVKTYQTQDEANQDLAAGRIDVTQADSVALQAFLDSDAGKNCCEVKGTVADDVEILGQGVGVGLRKGEEELKAKFNAAIKQIREDGTYDAITKNYFTMSIYGG